MKFWEFADRHWFAATLMVLMCCWLLAQPFDVLTTLARKTTFKVKAPKGTTPAEVEALGKAAREAVAGHKERDAGGQG